MDGRILIAYATKHGGTAEIGERIAGVLRAAGLEVDLLPAHEVREVSPYAGVILGSAVYLGSWRKEARRFLESHHAALAQRKVWLFSSGPTGTGAPAELLKGWEFPERQQPLVESIRPRGIVLFHGVLDNARLNAVERVLVKAVGAPLGDFRDWEQIESWARDVAADLGKAGAAESGAEG